jgi:hypothetical protein
MTRLQDTPAPSTGVRRRSALVESATSRSAGGGSSLPGAVLDATCGFRCEIRAIGPSSRRGAAGQTQRGGRRASAPRPRTPPRGSRPRRSPCSKALRAARACRGCAARERSRTGARRCRTRRRHRRPRSRRRGTSRDRELEPSVLRRPAFRLGIARYAACCRVDTAKPRPISGRAWISRSNWGCVPDRKCRAICPKRARSASVSSAPTANPRRATRVSMPSSDRARSASIFSVGYRPTPCHASICSR